MARIIENELGRRQIKVSADDIISLIREYQQLRRSVNNPELVYETLKNSHFYLPEEML